MRPLAHALRNLLHEGRCCVGELAIQSIVPNERFILSHWQDVEQAAQPDGGGLERHRGWAAARELSIYSAEGVYRHAKAQVNLRRGWVLELAGEEELLQALDLFYPAAVGLYVALRNGTLETENLRAKLERQTGMYRFARNISDAGAQRLVQDVCGPAHHCAKRILWQIDSKTPLEASEASQYNGIPSGVAEDASIPLLCREACNHFVAECREVAKREAPHSQGRGSV